MKAPCLTVIGVWAERSWDVSVRYGVTCRSLTNSRLKLGGGEPACRRGSAVPSRLTCGYGRKPGLTCFFDLPSVVIGSHAFEVSRVTSASRPHPPQPLLFHHRRATSHAALDRLDSLEP